jgi:hypothetical protein
MIEQSKCNSGFKKSLYVFLCSLLGMLLFLILHRLLVIGYFSLTSRNLLDYFSYNLVLEMAVEYLTLFFAILAGSWYGIWLGLGWYAWVYENENCQQGLVDHIVRKYWPSKGDKHNFHEKVKNLSEHLETSVASKKAMGVKPKVNKPKGVKKKIIRRKSKLNGKV